MIDLRSVDRRHFSTHAQPVPTKRRRRGFTLFEVLLVLSLSAVVMLMVGNAVRLNLRLTDYRGNAVENAQLARVVMRQISNDLRAATFTEDPNSGAATVAGGADPVGQEIDTASQTAPGIYGDLEQIRIDMVKTVDTREWLAMTDPENQQTVVDAEVALEPYGGLQTVAYFINGSAAAAGGGAASQATDATTMIQDTDDVNPLGGLVRQLVDQPVAAWALSNGGGAELDQFSQVYAPEVASITFQYFDGTQWLETWDSYVQGGLPVAVEVTIVMATSMEDSEDTMVYLDLENSDSVFTMVVHLPTALPTDEMDAQL